MIRRPVPTSVVLGLLLLTACATLARDPNWQTARRDSSLQAPDAASTPEAVIQVYAARTVGWKGVLGVHTWIALKRTGAPAYTRYEVIGWGVDRGLGALRVNRTGPDNYWFGSRPDLLVDVRGDGVDALIDRVHGPGFAITDRTIDSHIRNLRAKFAKAGAADVVETRAGVGYRLGACAGGAA